MNFFPPDRSEDGNGGGRNQQVDPRNQTGDLWGRVLSGEEMKGFIDKMNEIINHI